MAVRVPAEAKSMTISMVVLNADGTVKQDLGVVSQWHRNPVIRLWRDLLMRVRSVRGVA